MMTIRRAAPDDLLTVHSMLHATAGWLHQRGYDQWPDRSPSLTYDRLAEQIRQGETYIVSDGRDPVATIAVSPAGDPDFWTAEELAEPAVYCSKAAVTRRGEGLGALLMRWVIDRASMQGVRWARLDAWRTNHELQDYYRRTGWTYVRASDLPHRKSGALFQVATAPDPEARAAFGWQELRPLGAHRPMLQVGSPIIVDTPAGPVAATLTNLIRDYSLSAIPQGWENGVAGPPARFVVTRDERTWNPRPDQVWPDWTATAA
jgi:GNAT superfamily N-acetyltransferase